MNKKKEKPLFDISQAIIISRVAVTFLQNINNKGIIIKAGTTKKAELQINNTTGEDDLFIDFGEVGILKVPINEIVHEKWGELIKIHECGSKEAKKAWGEESNKLWEVKIKEDNNGN